MSMNPEYLQKYEDEMREKRRVSEAQAAREDAENEIARLRQEDLKPKMTAEQWDYKAFRIAALRVLCNDYEHEHDFDEDEDPSSTYELISEVRKIHDELVAELGPRPAEPDRPIVDSSDFPF